MYSFLKKIKEYFGIEVSTSQKELDDFFNNITKEETRFSEYLSAQIATRNLDPDKLVAEIGISRRMLRNYLDGKSFPRKKDTKLRFCKCFGISEEDLEALLQ